jgi:subtilisin family serine protease/PKD repeat protein
MRHKIGISRASRAYRLERKALYLFGLTTALALFAGLVLFVTSAGQAQGNARGGKRKDFYKGREVVAGEVLVKFRKSATQKGVDEARGKADADVDRRVGGAGLRLFRSRSKDTATLIEELRAHADVEYVEPNYVIRPAAVPNDPSFSGTWGLHNTGQLIADTSGTPGADMGAASAWDLSTGSRSNVVAVIDTGVDYNHPDLAANIWTAPAAFTVTIGGQTIRCEAGTHGFNAITKTCDPMDEYNHGTHVAGTIGAVGNDGAGVAGVNWTANIMAVKFIDSTGSGTLEDAIDAIEFTIQAKAAFAQTGAANVRVLSNSWGWNGDPSQALLDEIKRAETSDMLFVASAGNGGDDYLSDDNDAMPFYPASYDSPSVISVAATDNRDALGSFSNYGMNSVDIGAPGVYVLSTTMGGGYDYWSGTSMAAPHVSGAAALVLSKCTLDTAALKSAILENVDSVPSLYGVTTTGGRLNVNKALRSCANSDTLTPEPSPAPAPNQAPTVSITSPASGATYNAPAAVTISATASDADGTVSQVQFYSNNQLIGTDTTSPYSITWNNVAAGTYSVQAVVTDNGGISVGSSVVSIRVNQPPMANAGGPYSGTTGQLIQFNGSASSDPDGSIASYRWNFGDGTTGTGNAPTHAYSTANTYTVTLTVTDNSGATSSASATVKVTVPPPAAPANLSASSQRQNEVRLSWSDRSTNEQSFAVERSTSSGGGFVEIARVGANNTSYTDRTGQSRTTYYYRVRAANSGGYSGYSNTASVRVK